MVVRDVVLWRGGGGRACGGLLAARVEKGGMQHIGKVGGSAFGGEIEGWEVIM